MLSMSGTRKSISPCVMSDGVLQPVDGRAAVDGLHEDVRFRSVVPGVPEADRNGVEDTSRRAGYHEELTSLYRRSLRHRPCARPARGQGRGRVWSFREVTVLRRAVLTELFLLDEVLNV
jgi:hypothetical protein